MQGTESNPDGAAEGGEAHSGLTAQATATMSAAKCSVKLATMQVWPAKPTWLIATLPSSALGTSRTMVPVSVQTVVSADGLEPVPLEALPVPACMVDATSAYIYLLTLTQRVPKDAVLTPPLVRERLVPCQGARLVQDEDNDYKEAEASARRAVRLMEDAFGKNNPRNSTAYGTLAAILK